MAEIHTISLQSNQNAVCLNSVEVEELVLLPRSTAAVGQTGWREEENGYPMPAMHSGYLRVQLTMQPFLRCLTSSVCSSQRSG